jgi:lysophospholipase L1-like esterase
MPLCHTFTPRTLVLEFCSRIRTQIGTSHPSSPVSAIAGSGHSTFSVADITGNLSRMARAVKASGGRPLLLTVLPVGRPVFSNAQRNVNALNVAIHAMAKRQGVSLIDVASQFRDHYPLSDLFRHSDGREDGVHPNDAGYRLLASMVSTAVR